MLCYLKESSHHHHPQNIVFWNLKSWCFFSLLESLPGLEAPHGSLLCFLVMMMGTKLIMEPNLCIRSRVVPISCRGHTLAMGIGLSRLRAQQGRNTWPHDWGKAGNHDRDILTQWATHRRSGSLALHREMMEKEAAEPWWDSRLGSCSLTHLSSSHRTLNCTHSKKSTHTSQ